MSCSVHSPRNTGVLWVLCSQIVCRIGPKNLNLSWTPKNAAVKTCHKILCSQRPATTLGNPGLVFVQDMGLVQVSHRATPSHPFLSGIFHKIKIHRATPSHPFLSGIFHKPSIGRYPHSRKPPFLMWIKAETAQLSCTLARKREIIWKE